MEVEPEGARYRLGESRGHYESWFVRGNHPTRPLAFWVRYTVTSPSRRPQHAVAELFASVFDGERGSCTVARETAPLADSIFPSKRVAVRIGAARLERHRARGSVTDAKRGVAIAWDVAFSDGAGPLLLLPAGLYAGAFPRAKSLVIDANVTFSGAFVVNGSELAVDGWRGSLNHNWGERHTDRYAWGQVAGFPEAPDTTLELATARYQIGPLMTPAMTPIVLRHRGKVHALNKPTTLFGRAALNGLEWRFHARGDGVRLSGIMRASPLDVVTLFYANPPGGAKVCINTKIASCELDLETKDGGAERLRSPHGGAFELLVDRLADAGVPGLPEPL